MAFLSDLNMIAFVRELGLAINWTFLKIGFYSNTLYSGLVTFNDVLDFAIEKLECGCSNELILKLAAMNVHNLNEVECILTELSDAEEANELCELEKWKAVYLKLYLGEKKRNYIDGLCHLSCLWQEVGSYEEKAEFLQGVGNQITPESYYTWENYEIIYDKTVKHIAQLIKRAMGNYPS